MSQFIPVWDVKKEDTFARRFGYANRVTAWDAVQRLARQGDVRLIRVGRRLYVRVDDLDSLGRRQGGDTR